MEHLIWEFSYVALHLVALPSSVTEFRVVDSHCQLRLWLYYS